jgi:adiponectin receptor
MFYVAFGLSSVSYVGHGIVLHGWETQLSRMSLDRMGQMAIVNLVGATIYAARVSHRLNNRHLAEC